MGQPLSRLSDLGSELGVLPSRCLRLPPGGRLVCPIELCGVELVAQCAQLSREDGIGLMFDLLDHCRYTRSSLREYQAHHGRDDRPPEKQRVLGRTDAPRRQGNEPGDQDDKHEDSRG